VSLDAVDSASLRTAVLAQAALRPEAAAVKLGSQSLTYGVMAHSARVIANAVTHGGMRPVERVGVFAYRSLTGYAATLGALCAGAAFVPLSRKFPIERTREMLHRALLDAIVVDDASAAQLAEVLSGVNREISVIAPDVGVAARLRAEGIPAIGNDELAVMPPLADLPSVLQDDVAYLLFTSGTTGRPKGVAVSHRNVLHYLAVMQERYSLTPDDRCSQTFDQTFDLAVHDLFLSWSAGACVYAMQPIELLAPVRFVQKHDLTVWFSVPSAVVLAAQKGMLKPDAMPSLRYSLFCGEPLLDVTAQRWQDAAPNSAVDNLYGPTELTIACSAYRWTAQDSPRKAYNGIVPIGRPLAGLGAIVVDERSARVPDGETGELLVCGPQTSPGYWQDSERTAERFVELAVSPTRSYRFYRTGDRVRRTASGDYVYVGRTDNQIKVLGFRVELGEIEAVLVEDAGALQAVAAGWPVEDGRATGIVAFVSGTSMAPEEIALAVARRLPSYMVPSQVLVVAEMPLNANGKIDRRRLVATLAESPGSPSA
jgi:amino acid adenylation domain-containing protein